jgi:hypothetical protein
VKSSDTIPIERRTRRSLLGGDTILFLLALVKLLVHLLTAGNYGYFRDELYYIAASEHLSLGYVDFPPFVALATALERATLGDSLVALDLLPALAGAAVVVLAGLMARELGGGTVAQGLAALAVLVAPNFLVFGTFISMDAFDQLFWVSAAYTLLLILKRNEGAPDAAQAPRPRRALGRRADARGTYSRRSGCVPHPTRRMIAAALMPPEGPRSGKASTNSATNRATYGCSRDWQKRAHAVPGETVAAPLGP